MRTVIINVGAPATGKSTGAQRLQLPVVSKDTIREILAPRLYDTEGNITISTSYGQEKMVDSFFKEALTNKMTSGEDFIVDVTNLDAAKPAQHLAQQYRYTVLVCDYQGDLSDDEILARNARRYGTLDYVDPAIIPVIADKVRRQQLVIQKQHHGRYYVATGAKESSLNELLDNFRKQNTIEAPDLSGKRVIIIGDVHSSANALNAAIKELNLYGNRNTVVIFAGDLFDRGSDAVATFRLLKKLAKATKTVFVEGNHDTHLVNLLNGITNVTKNTVQTLEDLRAAGISDDSVRAFLKRLQPVYPFIHTGEPWLVTHGGLASHVIDKHYDYSNQQFLLYGLAANDVIRGSSTRGTTYRAKTDYEVAVFDHCKHLTVQQAFGHRNGSFNEQPANVDLDSSVIPLEARVENNGELRVLEITPTGDRALHTFTD